MKEKIIESDGVVPARKTVTASKEELDEVKAVMEDIMEEMKTTYISMNFINERLEIIKTIAETIRQAQDNAWQEFEFKF